MGHRLRFRLCIGFVGGIPCIQLLQVLLLRLYIIIAKRKNNSKLKQKVMSQDTIHKTLDLLNFANKKLVMKNFNLFFVCI